MVTREEEIMDKISFGSYLSIGFKKLFQESTAPLIESIYAFFTKFP